MISRTLADIEYMVHGEGLLEKFYELNIDGVSLDSRTITPGRLYIPIKRLKDGHDYVEEAFEKGASASLWESNHPNPPTDVPLIFVDDGLVALQRLAEAYRQQLTVKVIGITGSNGKTTTKDMVNSILDTTLKVHKTKGNLNSQIGVPLTILEIAPDAEVAVIEMGMSELGQIERLSWIAKPDISIITMIGVSHLSSLGSREAIAEAKLEIVSGMPAGGVLIFDGDEPLLRERVKDITAEIKSFCFGWGPMNDYIPVPLVSVDGESAFRIGNNEFRLSLLGKHNLLNATAAIAATEQLGLSYDAMRKGLEQVQITGMRMEKLMGASGALIINDAWNASPVSMRAAIETFVALEGYKRKIVVLGDMLELGEQEVEFHKEVGRMIDPFVIDYVLTVGVLGWEISLEAEKVFPKGRVIAFDHKDAVTNWLKRELSKDDAVLFKGSRGMALEKIVEKLI